MSHTTCLVRSIIGESQDSQLISCYKTIVNILYLVHPVTISLIQL